MTFNYNGLHFEAWEGGMSVSKNGKDVLRAIDVFRNGVPAAEKVVKFYEALVKISEKKEDVQPRPDGGPAGLCQAAGGPAGEAAPGLAGGGLGRLRGPVL